jgi:hypothetical protein
MTTLAEAQAKLSECMLAESNALLAKETRLTSASGIDRTDVQQDLRDIRKSLVYWRGEVIRLSARASGQPLFAGMTFSSANFGNQSGRE